MNTYVLTVSRFTYSSVPTFVSGNIRTLGKTKLTVFLGI